MQKGGQYNCCSNQLSLCFYLFSGNVLVTADIFLADWYYGGDIYQRSAYNSYKGNVFSLFSSYHCAGLWKSGFMSCPILLPGLNNSSIGLWNIFDDYLYITCRAILQTCPVHPYGYPLCKVKNASLQMQFYIEKNLINSPFKTVARFFVTQTKHSCI